MQVLNHQVISLWSCYAKALHVSPYCLLRCDLRLRCSTPVPWNFCWSTATAGSGFPSHLYYWPGVWYFYLMLRNHAVAHMQRSCITGWSHWRDTAPSTMCCSYSLQWSSEYLHRFLMSHSLCKATVPVGLWHPQTHAEGALTPPRSTHSLERHVLQTHLWEACSNKWY